MPDIYRTSDNREFDNRQDAERHQERVDEIYRDRSSDSSSSSSYTPSSSGSRRDSAAEIKASTEMIASAQARNDRIITDLYEKGNWKAIAKIDTRDSFDFSTKAFLMQAIAKAHLGNFDGAFARSTASEWHNWESTEKESLRVLGLELFRLAQQAWEKKNKRAMTAADVPNFNRYNLDAKELSNLGYLLYNANDYAFAVGFWKLAADKGDATAMKNVGVCYENGQGVPQDNAKALEWYKRLEAVDSERGKKAIANLQNPINQANAAYRAGDYAKAVELYRKAADMGNASAMHGLGTCYATGNGVTKDFAKAIEWYKKAIANGSEDAKKYLAMAEKQLAEQRK